MQSIHPAWYFFKMLEIELLLTTIFTCKRRRIRNKKIGYCIEFRESLSYTDYWNRLGFKF